MQLIKYLKDTWLSELLNMSPQITWFQPSLVKDISPYSLFSVLLPSARGNPGAWMGQTPSVYHCHCFPEGWAELIQGRKDGSWFSHPYPSCALLLQHHLIWEPRPEFVQFQYHLFPAMEAAVCCQIHAWLQELTWGRWHTVWPKLAAWFHHMGHLTQAH